MATQAQIDANRLNAQKSTGPRTPDGKAAIRQNAFRHGFTSSIPVMLRESDGDTRQLLAAFIEENQPVGVNEEILVYQMAEHFYFQRRASILMAEEFDSDDCGAREIALMLRYHTTAVRGFSRALNDLRKLQKERKLQEIGFVSQEVEEAPAEPRVEPPIPTAEPPAPAVKPPTPGAQPPKVAPLVPTQPVQTPIRVEPTAATPAEARKNVEMAPEGQPITPPKAA
jgi:hypothetical protein